MQESSKDNPKVKQTHKVDVGEKLFNKFEDPKLVRGGFATLLPLGFTKDDIGKGGTLPSKLVRTFYLMTRDLGNTSLLITSYLTRNYVTRRIPK